MTCARILLAASLLSFAVEASAQPRIAASVRPAPNDHGWNNGPVTINFVCIDVTICPEERTADTEGSGQLFGGTARDATGLEASTSTLLHIDRTAPSVEITSPAGGAVTAASIRVVARALDALSGVAGATCNGRQAPVDEAGQVQCVVALLPGVNNIVVEASDQADNSGSAGIRVTRIGGTSTLRIVPDALGVLVGSERPLQVLDDYGATVPDVVWRISDPQIGEMSDRGNTFTSKAPGSVTVTAIHGGLSAEAHITIYAGDRLPAGATRWHAAGLSVVETPDSTLAAAGAQMVSFENLNKRAKMSAIDQTTGRIDWIETPAVDESEEVVGSRVHALGGGVLVVESLDGLSSALVRGGEFAGGTPWRYRSAGRLAHDFAEDVHGDIAIIETGRDTFPQLTTINGRTGRVMARRPIPRGASVLLNVACVEHANSAREIPAETGPPRVMPDGTVVFEMMRVDDLEDFQPCGGVSGHLRRRLDVVAMGTDGAALKAVRLYELPARSPSPKLTLFPVASDGHGGLLAPWVTRLGDKGLVEARVTHFTSAGQQEYVVPVAGQVFLGTLDFAAMTDGATVVAFNVMTGEVLWTHSYPRKGVRIQSLNGTTLLVTHPAGSEMLDENGRLIPVK